MISFETMKFCPMYLIGHKSTYATDWHNKTRSTWKSSLSDWLLTDSNITKKLKGQLDFKETYQSFLSKNILSTGY